MQLYSYYSYFTISSGEGDVGTVNPWGGGEMLQSVRRPDRAQEKEAQGHAGEILLR